MINRMHRSWLAAALPVVFSIATSAQSWEVFDMATAGFGSNTINGIAEDGQGNIWATTNWGLCKYDGSAWTVYLTSNSGIPENTLTCVAVDSLDQVWVGTVFSGVHVFDGSSWNTYDTGNSGLPDNEIKCITIDHQGWAWIGTYYGLACHTGTAWRLYDDSPSSYNGLELNGNVIQDVAVRSDGLVMIATENGGFHYLTDTLVQVHSTYIDFFPDNSQTGVVFDEAANERWLSTPAQGLLRQGGYWYNGPWFQYAPWTSAIPTAGLTDVALDALGRPWCGSIAAGLIRRNTDGTYTTYDPMNSDLPDEFVTRVFIAQDGGVWAGTQAGGLARLDLSVGTSEEGWANGVRAYPNPVEGELTLDIPFSDEGSVSWTLVNGAGQSVGEGRFPAGETTKIPLSHLPSGAYTMSIRGSSRTAHLKVVVE